MNDAAVYEARLELVDFVIDVFWDVPEEAFVERLLSGEVQLPEDSINDQLDEGFEMLQAWIDDNTDRSVSDVQDELEREYTDLLVGPRPPVLPHETNYREDTEFIGEGLAEVDASYGAAGWAPPEDYPEEDDFIAVELAFLRYLIERQREGDEETVGYERVFIEQHLSEWVIDFADEMREEADEGLFLAAALICEGLVRFEDEIVAQIG
ncbi:molecular chaperone TorD [Haloarcula hispanica N601]|uniref:Molecular chaperone TorD n=3 Tax=Haloarcula hispanica TaxID=51589 RepID=A0A482T9P2_HALHI|nr:MULTISPECIES: molecular chaperone TorD family protein [Haloarcula]AEM57516.1 cytoplasmic chaperone TorD [Haloarcula hispanica ATCC 33960]AHB66280.1 molecular chaperone TorD [Haloarcula hispanica N601]AJF24587.1 molecular chaperone TorD [Haloarcula sp. CBA1115]KAA9406796.1 molecular chaperone TorD [Haloarcula sp. CBA1131]KAA9410167.1 molecular chaperone TorD [Haloarcula hispanica]